MLTDSKSIRWGIIGCGNVVEIKSGPAYQKTEGFELHAVTRRDLSKAKDFAARHNVPIVFPNAQTLIEDPEIDAVYIATHPDSHKEYALAVAASGKPCCIEKPMATHYSDCLEILNAFENAQRPLFVAYYRRCLPRFLKVKEWLDSGKIGSIRHVNWRLSKIATEIDRSGEYNWRTDANIAPGGYFDDLASHGLDFLDFLIGKIESVHGIPTNQQGFYKPYDAITACWIHDNKVTGTGSWNFGSHQENDKVEIFGSEGEIEFSLFQDVPFTCSSDEGQELCSTPYPENIQLPFVEAIRSHLRGESTHPSTGVSAARASWAIDQILAR